MKRTVRTTMRPDQTIEVDDIEYLDLKRQGLILADAPAPVPPATAPPTVPDKKTTSTAKSS